jgi:long-chain acyl-CoA synthetase
MKHVWLKHYPPGVPHEINADAWPSLAALLDEQIVRYRDHPALANFGTVIDYAKYAELSRNLAAWLQQRAGLGRGDRIALMLPNIMQYPVATYAALRAGLAVVNVNPLYSPRELLHQIRDADVDTIVILADVTPTLAEVIGQTGIRYVIVTRLDDLLDVELPSAPVDSRLKQAVSFKDVLREGAMLEFAPVMLQGDDLAFLQYTGGTTGLSRGAMLTHRNMVANALQMHAVFIPNAMPGREIYITALPLYHVFALTVNGIGAVHQGALNVLITNPRDMPAFVQELSRWPFTFISGVNTLYNGLLHTPGFGDLDFSSLRTAIAGGMALQHSVATRWQQVTGRPLLEGYGLSETAPCLSCNPTSTSAFNGTIGVPLPSTEIRIRDDAGNDLPPGTPGELCARGPQVMPGYWKRPEETRAVMTADGFLRTGDIAAMDEDGYFRIIDRKKDMINVSGFNVFPNEVEDVVAGLDGVLECACIGTPDEKSGEAVLIFIVPKPGATLAAADIIDGCRDNLAPYKIPRQVRIVDAIPKSNVGKILRRALREQVGDRSIDR